MKIKLCDMPSGTSWRQVFGVGLLSGVGFTVSFLITGLSFDSLGLVDEAKLGVLVASVVAGTTGFLFLSSSTSLPNHHRASGGSRLIASSARQ